MNIFIPKTKARRWKQQQRKLTTFEAMPLPQVQVFDVDLAVAEVRCLAMAGVGIPPAFFTGSRAQGEDFQKKLGVKMVEYYRRYTANASASALPAPASS